MAVKLHSSAGSPTQNLKLRLNNSSQFIYFLFLLPHFPLRFLVSATLGRSGFEGWHPQEVYEKKTPAGNYGHTVAANILIVLTHSTHTHKHTNTQLNISKISKINEGCNSLRVFMSCGMFGTCHLYSAIFITFCN